LAISTGPDRCRLHPTSDLTIHAVYPTTRNIALKARSFIDHLIASFGGDPPWDRPTARQL
jgi:hypothetical protein